MQFVNQWSYSYLFPAKQSVRFIFNGQTYMVKQISLFPKISNGSSCNLKGKLKAKQTDADRQKLINLSNNEYFIDLQSLNSSESQ